MTLWILYQISNAVIIMNLLIALMNATIAGIEADKITYWRFARTRVNKFLIILNNICSFRFGRNILIKLIPVFAAFLFHSTCWNFS